LYGAKVALINACTRVLFAGTTATTSLGSTCTGDHQGTVGLEG
jgi:hypothetical protein